MSLLAAAVVGAQGTGATPPSAPGGQAPPAGAKVIGTLRYAFTQPVHLVIGGVAPGSGFGGGIGYDSPPARPWTFGAKAVATMRRYWATTTELTYQGGRTGIDAYGRLREMPELAFYGLGNESVVEDRSNFGMREGVVGTLATARVAPWITIGARAEANWAKLRGGNSSEFPSIEALFAPSDVPGMSGPGRYARYEASLNVRLPAAVGAAFYQGARYRIAYAYFDDLLADQFTFTRVDLEAQHRFTMPIPQHHLTLHGWVSAEVADAGQRTPFYLQRTLGGKSFLRSMHDNNIGSDGSAGTLRGFSELRFRDRNLLLLQAEYRVPVWGPIDATAYVDAGKVAHDRSGLDLTDLKHNFGFSLSAMRGTETAARFDVAFGGGEGYRIFFTLGVKGTQ